MGHIPSSEAHNYNSVSKEILRILGNTKIYYRFCNSPQLFVSLNHNKPVHQPQPSSTLFFGDPQSSYQISCPFSLFCVVSNDLWRYEDLCSVL